MFLKCRVKFIGANTNQLIIIERNFFLECGESVVQMRVIVTAPETNLAS